MDNLSVRRAHHSRSSRGRRSPRLGTEEAENRHVMGESQVLDEV